MDNIFDDFFPNGLISLEDNFSVDSKWKKEINKWLVCVRNIDPQYYERSKTRVKQNTHKQEETLAEIRSIYFLKTEKACTILALEPGRADLSFNDKMGTNWVAEIKCPSYVKEIFENNLTKEEGLKRKQQPKNINEIFAFDFKSGYVDAIKNSLAKFKKYDNNLLIISDNRFIPLVGDPFLEENINEELKQLDPEGKISSVLLLNVQGRLSENFKTSIKYNYRIVTISNKLSI